MLAPPTAAVAVPMPGVPGAVAGATGVIGAVGALSVPPPPVPLARTRKLTAWPLVRPVTVVERSVPGTVTFLISLPWLSNALTSKDATSAPAGSDHVTRAAPLRANAVTLSGAGTGLTIALA